MAVMRFYDPVNTKSAMTAIAIIVENVRQRVKTHISFTYSFTLTQKLFNSLRKIFFRSSDHFHCSICFVALVLSYHLSIIFLQIGSLIQGLLKPKTAPQPLLAPFYSPLCAIQFHRSTISKEIKNYLSWIRIFPLLKWSLFSGEVQNIPF